MLELKNIVKDYVTGDETVHALKGLSITFRDSEFVSVLGQSGCGKTTLLNIIGGLDQYTSGDLVIDGRSTKDYSDKDWDTYRNHSVGFVFQTYNLISHQTVLANVELALTISGVSAAERRQRATQALEAVGLGDQLHKKPNQLSGGQMQRVAIARALVNDPEIVLADEPTGALDSATSVAVMDILKEVARDRLVIMVTHNPDLAEQYSTRVVRLLDGRITEDSNPYEPVTGDKTGSRSDDKGKRRMSLRTALGLSMNNLLTKKGRTILTAFAGSIGIIGIALILSLSNGTQEYINRMEQDTLSSYPIEINAESMDMAALMSAMTELRESSHAELEEARNAAGGGITGITSSNIMTNIISSISSGATTNDLAAFRTYLEQGEGHRIYDLVNALNYGYSTGVYLYNADYEGGVLQVNPSTLLANAGLSGVSSQAMSDSSGDQLISSFGTASSFSFMNQTDVFDEMLDNEKLIGSQYDVLAGHMPQAYDEVVLIVTDEGRVSDYLLYAIGLKDQSDVADMFDAVAKGEELESAPATHYEFDDFLGMTFKLVLPTDYYQRNDDGTWSDVRNNAYALADVVARGTDVRIVGVICPNVNASIAENTGSIGYTSALQTYAIEAVANSDIVKAQLADPEIDVFTGKPFPGTAAAEEALAAAEAAQAQEDEQAQEGSEGSSTNAFSSLLGGGGNAMGSFSSMMGGASTPEVSSASSDTKLPTTMEELEEQIAQLPDDERAKVERQLSMARAFGMSDEDILASMEQMNAYAASAASSADDDAVVSSSTYEANLARLELSHVDTPSSIAIYAKDFASKEEITHLIESYNSQMRDAGEDDKVIQYSDYVGLLIGSVRNVIDAISYILIAFVAISLVVSSIMIGIITYISVLERTKEIGILRSIGASKRDVSRVFNAETFVIGLVAGVIGIVVTVILDIPANIIIENITGVHNLAVLPPVAAVGLIVISVILTLIGGIIPSRLAANRDPVQALRTE